MPLLLPLVLFSVQASTISVTFPPIPVRDALTRISRASGRNLDVAPALYDEIVLARLKDASVETALAHIAEVLCAKWEDHPDGKMWLVPDPLAAKRLDDSDAAEAETHLLNSLNYLRKRLGQQPIEMDQASVQAFKARKEADEKRRKAAEAAEDWAHMFTASSVGEESPAWRACAQLTLKLDVKALLAMPNNAREVWAENPTPMQHALPDGAEEVLRNYRRELNLVDPSMTIARVKLVLEKWEEGSAFNVQFEGDDAAGKPIDTANARMNDDAEKMKIPFTERENANPKPGDQLLVRPVEAQESDKALAMSYKGQDRAEILKRWRQWLLDPVHSEPMHWDYGDDLVLSAEAKNKNLIGTVNDLLHNTDSPTAKVSANQILAKNAEDILPSKDGWLVVRSHERRLRASRSTARDLIGESVRQGGITVDAAAAWAAHQPEPYPFTNWLGEYLHVLLTGGGRYSAIATTLDDQALRLWGCLGSGVLDSLHRGDTVRLSLLSAEAKTQIAKMVYWFQSLDDEHLDPTDVLPNGIADGAISLTTTETPVFIGWSSKVGPPAVPSPIDAKQFGRYLAKGNSYFEVSSDIYRAFDRFRVGLNRAYNLHIVLNPGSLPMTVKLSETFFDPNAENHSELPDDLKAEAEKARLAALSQPKAKGQKDLIPPR